MANLKYKDNNGNWQILNTVRGPKGDNADITLNGQTHINASFYAPEQSGIIGQFLTSYGSGNSPVWVNLSRVAATGNYDDLNSKPIIPTTTSDIISGSTAALTSGGAFTALAQRGIPSGGSAGQILIKSSGTDYAVEWGSVIKVENSLTSTSTTNALSAAQGKILNTNKQDRLISGTNIKTINNQSLLGNGDITVDNLPINSIIEYDGDTIPEGYEIYTDYTTTVQKTLFETTSWGSMMKRFETKSIDFSSYDYVEVEFTGQGGTNATNTILKIDLHQPVKTTMTNDDISYKYGASICFPDIQLLQGTNNDPGIFRIGACISTAKDRIWMGDSGYFSGQTNSGNFDTNSTYNRISKIVGFKFVQKLKKKFQGALVDNKIVNTYSESQTDTYSCNYINEARLEEYSTTEKIVGKWMNGKPIYRKVLNVGTVTSQKSYISHNIANLGKLVNLYGTFNRSDNVQQIIPGDYTNWEIYLYDVSSTEITLYFSANQWNSNPYDIVLIIEYTKTTD